MANYSERVQRGAKVLDSVYPDWRKRVDVERLDMQNDHLDIIGQVTEQDYNAGRWTLQQHTNEPVWEQSQEFGFSDIGENPDYEALQAAWIAEISSN